MCILENKYDPIKNVNVEVQAPVASSNCQQSTLLHAEN